MAIATDRASFKELILRRLGKGVIRIEVSDDSVDDQIDYALARFRDYHFDGSAEVFYKHQITATDIANKWIPVPDDTIGVVEIFDISSTLMGVGMWNVQYQYVLSNMPNWGSMDLTSYWMTMSNITLMQQILVGKQPIRWNRYINQLQLDMSWDRLNEGDFLVARIYQAVAETNPKLWSDQWLVNYTTQLVKKMWGNNTKKYSGMQLPNGQSFNGQTIYDEAVAELEKLDEQLIRTYSLPATDMMG